MAEINIDPYKEGDPLGPTGRVTAIFDAIDDLKAALPDLSKAGFHGSDCAVFIGEQGSLLLDKSGEHRDIVGLRIFQNAVCDEGVLFEQFEATLAKGGAIVAVLTNDNEEKKNSVTAILKSHRARKINYWGTLHFDALG